MICDKCGGNQGVCECVPSCPRCHKPFTFRRVGQGNDCVTHDGLAKVHIDMFSVATYYRCEVCGKTPKVTRAYLHFPDGAIYHFDCLPVRCNDWCWVRIN